MAKSKRKTRLATSVDRENSLFPEDATVIDRKIERSADIRLVSAQDAGSMGHIARLLAQFGLPHTDPGDEITSYTRENGDLKFTITPLGGAGGGVPWGTLPRLLLAFVSTEAVLTKSPRIELGANISSFLRDELAMTVTGGKNGTITRIKEQAYKLFTSNITIIQKRSELRGSRTLVGMMNFASSVEMWQPHTDKDPDEVWQSTIELDPAFFKAITDAAVPIDWRVVRGVQTSPLALDLYFWLTYRMRSIRRATPIPLSGPDSLYEQLGCGYANTPSGRYKFKNNLGIQIANIKKFWPKLDVRFHEDGKALMLHPSPTSVSTLIGSIHS